MNLEFELFVKSFDMSDESIRRKYWHSLRVQELSLKLGDSRKKLASVIRLLHDYGRFYQWTKYKTFNDKESIDHADYGVLELFEKNEIERFYQDKKDYKIIYEAIKYHNKYSISADVTDRFMCEMIRDADKLDILYMYAIDELKLSEEGDVSDKINSEFYKHNLINFDDVSSKIDRSINVLSLVYDLNFKESFNYLKENNIFDKIYDKIIYKEKFKSYIDEIKMFIDSKL